MLELCVLNALVGQKEQYGYDLVKSLGVPGFGVTEGTIYPLLSRLRMQGLVTTRLEESSGGPARKYCSLTPKGRKTVKQMNEYVELLIEGSEALCGNGG